MRIWRSGWWAPPADDLSRALVFGGMPPSLAGFIVRVTGWSQLWLSLLAVAVALLNMVPLELQRLLLNAIAHREGIQLIVELALVYGGLVLASGLLKLLMNVWRGWVGEKAVRALRLSTNALVAALPPDEAAVQGVGLSLMLSEPEPIGGFVGIAVSELALQVSILASVFGYMFYTQPSLAAVCLAVFAPQFVFVPLMQRAINRRVQARILLLREASVEMLSPARRGEEKALQEEMRYAQVFSVNMGVYRLKFSMNFLMNLTQNLAKVVILGVGGWYVLQGRTQIGTVVAFVSGLNSVNDPWGDLVNWFQDVMVNRVRYRTFRAATQRFAERATAPA